MADRQGISIPWGSLIAIAAFVGSTLLVPQAFDVLRPAEKERLKPLAADDLEIDARLWEDPFGAMRRSETERQATCERKPPPPGCNPEEVQARRGPATLKALLAGLVEQARQAGDAAPRPLVLAVTVPGAPFVGAEEARRRTRYAVLSGLQAGGYVPYNAERMGLLSFEMPGLSALQVPYETLLPIAASERPLPDLLDRLQREHLRPRVLVLWIDETALPKPKIGALAEVLGALSPDGPPNAPDLAVIGPSSSDGLQLALRELHEIAQACAGHDPRQPCKGMTRHAWSGFRQLAAARLVNASATASRMYMEAVDKGSVRGTLTTLLNAIDGERSGKVDWRRTLATDDRMVRQMVAELLRRLPQHQPRRVLLVAERDSLYAQAMVEQFAAQLSKAAPHLQLGVSWFFRGLDGITARDGGERAVAPVAKSANNPAAIEWPESRDQLDYLRRLAQSVRDIEQLPERAPIGAIGIIANDVHDKLLVLQALHEAFNDRVFFTIDMDARFAHPRALPFTRNLIVVSGLPLELQPGLTAPIAPLRDMYQTAAFLAAQRALCTGAACELVDSIIDAMRENPSVYEIGRTRAVPVGGYDHDWRESDANPRRARLAAMLLGVLAFTLLVWPTTPAIREMLRAVFSRTSAHFAGQRLQWPTLCTVAAYLMVLAYAAVLAVEFVQPGYMTLAWMAGIVGGTGAAAITAMTALLWAKRAHRVGRWERVAPVVRHAVLGACGVAMLIALAALWQVMTLWSRGPPQPPCSDCEPVSLSEGISAWPSQAVFVLTMLTVVYALDRIWEAALRSMAEDHQWLGIGVRQPVPPAWGWDRLPRRAWRRLRCTSLMLWPHRTEGAVKMARLWRQYQLRGRPGARVNRTLLALGVTLTLAGALLLLLEGAVALGVPVRGQAQRTLASASFYAIALLLLPLLMVAVGDSTMLAARFITLMGRDRSRYPAAVVARFAAAQGPQNAALWQAPVASLPSARNDGIAPPPALAHSLLDDWIDVQVVARRTEVVSPLIIWPLVVVAMILLARSRLFDNWAFTLPVALVGAAYLAWTVTLSVWLKVVCERLRDQALQRMNADLQWLAGGSADQAKLAEPMKRLIAAVTDERRGAFAGLMEQPLFRGLMVPLGGVGGAQIFDYLLLAH